MKFIFALLMFISVSIGYSQNAPTKPTENVKEIVTNDLKQIYGEYYDMYFAGKPESIQFYIKIYKRCEYIPLSQAPSGVVKNLSDLDLFNKYNPDEIYYKAITHFDPETFNPLKYRFPYYQAVDLYYRIYQTNFVLKIKSY